MEFVDTHAHLYSEDFIGCIDEVMTRAKTSHVTKILLPDIDSYSRESMLQLHRSFSNFTEIMLGLHPTSVKENYRYELEKLDESLSSNTFCAIGETGIDLYWDKTFFEYQVDAFKYQIDLALKHNVPIVIHSRKSLNEIFHIINPYKNKGLKGVFHCFPGNIREAEKAVESGFFLGIGGVVTYKNSAMAEVVKEFPLQNLLLETDAPYLTPVPYRGKRNESSYLVNIAQHIATIKKCDVQQVAEITTQNAKSLFNL